ncbi:sodium-independent sulfate anion transporter [Episyrphus balteatus]|uniref:sodium-independent sulfate anion transporter n=1 Tax=Episyrphus balteatus TaxID=286459 RepID=UPI0024853147|nr:sodium-independent sulfate anion transporter [Episyrphus balteatus]
MSSSGFNSAVNFEERKPFHIENNVKVKPKTEIKPKTKKEQNWIFRRVHILTWIKTYDSNKALADLIAGVTLGLTIIPQSIAYAALAGLSSQYGLYSSFVGSFVYVIFGTIPQVSIGPTSLMALLTLKYTMDLPIEFTVVLAFISGVIELAMGVLNLGFVVSFISHPVTSAFTSGTSVVIICAQLKNLLGIKTKNIGLNPLNYLNKISLGDCTLGFVCICILLLLRQLNAIKFRTNNNSKKILKKCLWYISISRNAIVVFGSSLLAYYLANNIDDRSSIPFTLSKKVNSTMPTIELPPFVIEYENVSYSFSSILSELGSGIVVVPIVAVLANVAIAKAFVKDSTLDASQEMLTLGMCNIAGSFFSAMPTCGAFTRSAVSQASGVRTPFAGVYTGTLVLLALGTLTPYFEYIPKSTLSAVLISAVLFMLDFNTLKELWRKNKMDCFNWILVFVVCISWGVEIGLLLGIVVNFFFVSIRLTNPKIDAVLKHHDGYYYIHVIPCSEIYYSGADHFRSTIKSICVEKDYLYPIAIDCQKLTQSDYTILLVLKNIISDLQEKNVQVYLQNINLTTKKNLLETETNVVFCNSDIELQLAISS